MAEITTVARPYAKAAFAWAREKNALHPWREMLAFAAAVVTDERMAAFLARPQLTAQQQSDAVIGACGDRLDNAGRNFITQLCGNRRIAALPTIRDQFETMVAELEKLGDVQVSSAYPVEEAQVKALAAALARHFGQEVRINVEVDPSLMGGAVFRFGDQVIDGSVRSKLQKLAATLNS
jgi:F-type H+-transporting ATPase subunit delta